VHIAIQTEQGEIEQILIQHYAEQHGFDLKSIQWEFDPETNRVTAISVAEPLAEKIPPAPTLSIDENMVRRIFEELLNKHISAMSPAPQAPPPMVSVETKHVRLADTTPPPAAAPPKKEPAKTQLGHVVSWLENPEEAPHHPSDTPEKVAKRREKLLRARREAGGVLGMDDADEMFDPRNPPNWADTEKH
jgi:hypothetical protein